LSPALFLTVVALSLSLATLAGARRNPIPVAPTWVAVIVTGLAGDRIAVVNRLQ
jgi:hypothetical protein